MIKSVTAASIGDSCGKRSRLNLIKISRYPRRIAILSLPLLLLTNTATAASMDTTFRAECRKTSDRGCSADKFGVYQAPSGYYIEPKSISVGEVINYWKKQPRCHLPILDGLVSVPFPGSDAVATFYTSFKAPIHVESGSGFADMGKVAFVDCRYRFQVKKLP